MIDLLPFMREMRDDRERRREVGERVFTVAAVATIAAAIYVMGTSIGA